MERDPFKHAHQKRTLITNSNIKPEIGKNGEYIPCLKYSVPIFVE